MRSLKGLTQEEMAEKLNMSESGYAKIEQGKTKLQNPRLEKIVEVLGIELKDLLSFDEKTVIFNKNDNSFIVEQYGYANSTVKVTHELEKYKLLLEQKEIENNLLREQIEQLKEILALVRKKQELY